MSTNDITSLPGPCYEVTEPGPPAATIIRKFRTRQWWVIIFVETVAEWAWPYKEVNQLYRLVVSVGMRNPPRSIKSSWYDSPWASHSYLGGDPLDDGDPPTLQKGVVDTLVRYYGRATVGGAIKKARKLTALHVKERLRGML